MPPNDTLVQGSQAWAGCPQRDGDGCAPVGTRGTRGGQGGLTKTWGRQRATFRAQQAQKQVGQKAFPGSMSFAAGKGVLRRGKSPVLVRVMLNPG